MLYFGAQMINEVYYSIYYVGVFEDPIICTGVFQDPNAITGHVSNIHHPICMKTWRNITNA